MTHEELLRAIQSRAARIAVGASTARGRGNGGVVAASRDFFTRLDLGPFGGAPANFGQTLDQTTQDLLMALPSNGRHWGLARKLVNIFLRDCLYTTHLDSQHRLSASEHLFELPLDSLTAKALKRATGRGMLPQWPGLRHLAQDVSASFQEAAKTNAASKTVARVHLDAVWWSLDRDASAA
jgi:hypothetical protein